MTRTIDGDEPYQRVAEADREEIGKRHRSGLAVVGRDKDAEQRESTQPARYAIARPRKRSAKKAPARPRNGAARIDAAVAMPLKPAGT